MCVGRVLNAFCRRGIAIGHVRTSRCRLRFDVCDSYRQAIDCLDSLGVSYTQRRLGLGHVVRFLRRRPALWIGTVVACVVLVLCANVVWDTRIACPDYLADSVRAVLAECGASAPVWRGNLDTDAIKHGVEGIEGVALVSVYRRGVFLQVDVKEELPKGQLQLSSGPIVATCDCIVSRVVVESGRAMVQAGDTVRKGDVLIAPEYLVDKEADVTVPSRAVGEVYGYTYPTVTTQYAERTFRTVRTGARHTEGLLMLAGRTFGTIAPSPYAQCEVEERTVVLGDVVPVEVHLTTYYETRQEEFFAPWATAKERVLEGCYLELTSQIKKDVQIRRKWCIIDNMGSIYRVRAYAEVEQTVGVYYDEE